MVGNEFDRHPIGWLLEKLGEFSLNEKGRKPKRVVKEQKEGYMLPYVNIKAFEKNLIDEYTDGEGCTICNENDFLMVWDGSRSGYVGRALYGAVGSTLVKINFPGINNLYAYYYLQSKYLEINTKAKGTGTPHVDPNILWNYQFPIAPIQEQRRIVEKIEELFSELDNGIETLKTIQQQLKIYRQSVLKWAFEGKLTNVQEIEPKRLYLEQVCEFITKGTTPSKDKLFQGTGEIPFIKVYNLTFGDELDFTIEPTFVSFETHTGFLKRSKVFPGDVLMNIVGPPLGKVSIVPNTYAEWNINQAIARFRCKDEMNNKFLMYFLLWEPTTIKLKNKSKATAGQINLTLQICREIEIPVYDYADQIKIVQEIESRLSICDKLEETIEHCMKQADLLRQSILKKAFEGKLVPQDPNDEPAELLLERIREERVEKSSKTSIKPKRSTK
ncbi:type I restriction enzyme, S subunit [Paenibacillus algorifonticola]|uniref:Type I restriction enzyme, S subunit n=1 Tax=Paenibacillus algorifonticola TaxID=684063 RepID=A0A1I2J5C5_9BACL|nr:restriction endonuclease subunit S [Paenibacillus algorifonticola]SFF49744.1 type I restriction enzyme, S subunit [Paenibacillus algorifonticola]